MNLRRSKREPRVSASLASIHRGGHRSALGKAALVGGLGALLTAGSAAISSYRRRTEAKP
jgi:hypothetical protein